MFHEKFKELGDKYLVRTREEFDLLQQAFVKGRAGDAVAIEAVRNMAHRICGSGAMLGFMKISDVSGKIEAVLRNAELAPVDQDWAVIAALLQQLDAELQDAQLKISAGQ